MGAAASREGRMSYKLTEQDGDMAALLLSMLRNSPWPSSDPRWKVIEAWAETVARLTLPPTVPSQEFCHPKG
jgi:hypothetical protein